MLLAPSPGVRTSLDSGNQISEPAQWRLRCRRCGSMSSWAATYAGCAAPPRFSLRAQSTSRRLDPLDGAITDAELKCLRLRAKRRAATSAADDDNFYAVTPSRVLRLRAP